jgi:hypothetical protein
VYPKGFIQKLNLWRNVRYVDISKADAAATRRKKSAVIDVDISKADAAATRRKKSAVIDVDISKADAAV